jgi:hypothetical protein
MGCIKENEPKIHHNFTNGVTQLATYLSVITTVKLVLGGSQACGGADSLHLMRPMKGLLVVRHIGTTLANCLAASSLYASLLHFRHAHDRLDIRM